MKKKIVFVTGTRADFGKLKPLIESVDASKEFESYIFATGMHTLSRYGHTIKEIQRCGFKKIFPYINQSESTNTKMDLILADTIKGLNYFIHEFSPDMIIVHGDRVETLAGAIVGSLNNILVAHIEGGELSGTIDELIRHAVSKLAHIHFVSNEEARLRLIQMGEIPSSIFLIGSPDIDVMMSDKLPSISEAKKRYGIKFDEYLIFAYHPVTTEISKIKQNVSQIVRALEESKLNFIVIYPNNDMGSDLIHEEIYYLKKNKCFRLYPSLRFEYFLTLLKNSRAIVGNSSAGIREAPVYGVPTINIGNRQKNRFNHRTIYNIEENFESLLKILLDLPEHDFPCTHFGNGKSAKLFMKNLQNESIWKISVQKQFNDLV